MQQAVRIKSYPNKLVLFLNEELDFSTLLEEIGMKFKETSKFFGNAKMILHLNGKILTDEEEQAIIDCIQTCSSIEILYLEKDLIPEVISEDEPSEDPKEHVRFFKGTVSDGEMLEAPCDLVILGNVHPNATVKSSGSIFIYGGLYGEANAGVDNGEEYVISALDFAPVRITIGDYEYTPSKGLKWKSKKHFSPQIACVKDKKIITEQITKDLLDSLT